MTVINQKLFNKAINYITSNMMLKPSLEEVASVVGFSKFHFHRIFKEYTGETLASFIKRIRLEHSAFLLIFYKHRSITDVALSCGFMSSQSFSTAFKKYYQISPTLYKQKKGCGGIAISDPKSISKYEVSIQFIEGFDMVYKRTFGAYDNQSIEIKQQKVETKYPNKSYIGLSWDNPHITPNQNCRYDVGYILEDKSSKSTLPTQSVESQTYVTLTLQRKNINITKIWEYLYINWLHKPNSIFCFESFRGETISFYLPIKKI